MTTNNNYYGSSNAFSDWTNFLEKEPASAYYSSPAGMSFYGQSPNAQRFYQTQFQNIYNEFLGSLGSQIRSGMDPTMRWADYLENVPFTERYAALSPQQAGRTTRQYSPGTRQIYF